MILFLSKGFLEKSLSLQPERCFKIKKKVELDKLFIMARSPNDFSIEEISNEEGVRKLYFINNYETMTINKFLNHYLLINDGSRLLNKEVQILNNFKTILNNKKVFYVNINQANIKQSFSEIERIISKDG